MLARPADRQTTLHCSPCPHARLADSHQEVLAKYTHGMIRSIANKPKKGKIYHGQGSNQVHRSGTAPEAAALDRSATVTHRTLQPPEHSRKSLSQSFSGTSSHSWTGQIVMRRGLCHFTDVCICALCSCFVWS